MLSVGRINTWRTCSLSHNRSKQIRPLLSATKFSRAPTCYIIDIRTNDFVWFSDGELQPNNVEQQSEENAARLLNCTMSSVSRSPLFEICVR